MDKAIESLAGSITGSAYEINRLFPDSLLFGGLILYFVTQNVAYRMFAILVGEVAVASWAINWVLDRVQPRSPATGAGIRCSSGYRAARLEADRIQTQPDRFPSYSALTLGALLSYTATVMIGIKDTLDTMGPDWGSRFYVALVMSGLFVAYFIGLRIYTGCETFGGITVGVAAGALLGLVLYWINRGLFSEEANNILGLPYLVDKNKTGEPIYVCAPRITE